MSQYDPFEDGKYYKERVAALKAEIKRVQAHCPHLNLQQKHVADAIMSWDKPPSFNSRLNAKVHYKCPDCGKKWTVK